MSKSTNMEHVEVLREMRDIARAAIKAGDWKVDGACDPDAALRRADAAIVVLSTPQPPAEAQPVGVEVVDRVAAALLEEATDEPWTVAGVEHEGPDRDYYRKLSRKVLTLAAQQPTSDGGFTAGDMMVARQEGRREAWRRAAMSGPAATLADRVDRVATLLDGHGPLAESAAANLRNALASYDVAIAGQQGGEA